MDRATLILLEKFFSIYFSLIYVYIINFAIEKLLIEVGSKKKKKFPLGFPDVVVGSRKFSYYRRLFFTL